MFASARTSSQPNPYGMMHCPGEVSRIFHIESFLLNLNNTLFVDYCDLSNSSDTQTAIFADHLNNYFGMFASGFQVPVHPSRASSSVISHLFFQEIKKLSAR